MANAQTGGDVSQRGPREYLDPFAPVSSQFKQLLSMMELVFEDPEEFLQDLTEDILTLPPEKRFTGSTEVLREHVDDRFGSADAVASTLPESDPEKLFAFLEQLFDRLLTDILEGVFFQRNPEEHLVLAALVQTLNSSVNRLSVADEQEARNRLVSTMLALSSRLQHILANSPERLPDEAVWDTAYGLHYVTVDDEQASFPNPAGLSFDEAKQEVIQFGAVIAYTRLDISLSRGAELADVGPDAFRAKLDRFDVQPRFGPDSVEELYEDGIDE